MIQIFTGDHASLWVGVPFSPDNISELHIKAPPISKAPYPPVIPLPHCLQRHLVV